MTTDIAHRVSPDVEEQSFGTAILALGPVAPSDHTSDLPQRYEDLLPASQAVIDKLCEGLVNKPAEIFFAELMQRGMIEPEVGAVLRDDLIEVFQNIRNQLRVAMREDDDSALRVLLFASARNKLLQYMKSVYPLIDQVKRLSGELVHILQILVHVLGTKDLAAIPNSELNSGLQAIAKLQEGSQRLCHQIALRLGDHLRVEGDPTVYIDYDHIETRLRDGIVDSTLPCSFKDEKEITTMADAFLRRAFPECFFAVHAMRVGKGVNFGSGGGGGEIGTMFDDHGRYKGQLTMSLILKK